MLFKRLNKKGFTLAELLIVVAIIGVLVAVSIPIFTAQLEKSREATDMANLRAAKAALITCVLDADESDAIYKALQDSTKVYYDAQNGVLTTKQPSAYGKGTTADTKLYDGSNEYKYASKSSYTGMVIAVSYNINTETATVGFTAS